MRFRTSIRHYLVVVGCFGFLSIGSVELAGQQIPLPAANLDAPRSPLRTTEPVTGTRTLVGYAYQENVTLRIPLTENFRIPGARGEARVERRRGTTRVQVEVEGMKPATEFGGDFATYVFWTISPEGQVENTGEFVLRGERSALNVTTPLQTFGMLVTAEPHAMARRPSTFVVLTNQVREGITLGITRSVVMDYRGYEGIYNYEISSLVQAPYARGDVRSEVAQARSAIRLAERAGASEFAPEQLERARGLFVRAGDAFERREAGSTAITLAHDAIRLALDAQVRSEELRYLAALDTERAEYQDEIRLREAAIREAQSEGERARLETEERELELALERQAREAAMNEAHAASLRAATAEEDSLRAGRDREEALERMQYALGLVAQTRMTAQGLIVSLPDILFDFNISALKPEAREVLSRICGILSVTGGGYQLQIEGHTDSIGNDDYNQSLSEKRAEGVRSYIDGCGLRGTQLRSRGFGESRPIATNDTPEGRSQNRRVEILVQDMRQ